MPRKRSSAIWLLPDAEFRKLVEDSLTCGDVLTFFGFPRNGNNWKTVKKRCLEQGVSTAHFDGKKRRNRGRKVMLEDVLIEHSSYSRCTLKKRLLREGILPNVCAICGLLPIWNSQPLVLRLDHVNGVHDDARINNLRLVCPNCDSQLPTFAGRNTARTNSRNQRNNCEDCGRKVTIISKRCRTCSSRQRHLSGENDKILWPDNLSALVAEKGNVGVARLLGVSETAVRHKIKKRQKHSGA